jgi:hypothetical protein
MGAVTERGLGLGGKRRDVRLSVRLRVELVWGGLGGW